MLRFCCQIAFSEPERVLSLLRRMLVLGSY